MSKHKKAFEFVASPDLNTLNSFPVGDPRIPGFIKQLERVISSDPRPAYDFENLVFQGGGAKAAGFMGALKAAETFKIIPGNVKRVLGSSSGGIVAALVACGYTADEMISVMLQKPYEEFQDSSWNPFGKSFPMKQYGLYSGNNLREWYGELIKTKMGSVDATFAQLFKKRGMDLTLTGTNLSRRKTVYFNYRTHPNMPIRDALRITASIPFLFGAVHHDGDIYVDGGMLNNYAIHFYDAPEGEPMDGTWYVEKHIQGGHQKKLCNKKTLGFRLFSMEQLQEARTGKNVRREIDSMMDFGVQVLDTFATYIEKEHMLPEDWMRTVKIDTGDLGDTDLDISVGKKLWLMSQGVDACCKFMNKWDAAKKLLKHPDPMIAAGHPSPPLQPIGSRKSQDGKSGKRGKSKAKSSKSKSRKGK